MPTSGATLAAVLNLGVWRSRCTHRHDGQAVCIGTAFTLEGEEHG